MNRWREKTRKRLKGWSEKRERARERETEREREREREGDEEKSWQRERGRWGDEERERGTEREKESGKERSLGKKENQREMKRELAGEKKKRNIEIVFWQENQLFHTPAPEAGHHGTSLYQGSPLLKDTVWPSETGARQCVTALDRHRTICDSLRQVQGNVWQL